MEQKYGGLKSTTNDNQKILEYNSVSTGLTTTTSGNTEFKNTVDMASGLEISGKLSTGGIRYDGGMVIQLGEKDDYDNDIAAVYGEIGGTNRAPGVTTYGYSKLRTNHKYGYTVLSFESDGLGGWTRGSALEMTHNTLTSQYVVYIHVGSTVFSMQEDGIAKADTWSSTSDDRLKHNEEEITNALSTIKKLSPQIYDKTLKMLDEDYNGPLEHEVHKKEAGFIAQEVKEIPELAFMVQEPSDANSVYSLNYTNLHAYTIAALQELDAKVSSISNTSNTNDTDHSITIDSMKEEIDQLNVDLVTCNTELANQSSELLATQTELDNANAKILLLESKLQQLLEKNEEFELRLDALENA